MRVAFFYPSSSMRLPVDIRNIWNSPRGLTGSEIAFFMFALEIAKRGHGVTIFTKVDQVADLGPITCCHYEEWASTYHSQPWGALCSWMTPEPLKIATHGALRLFNQQVSDFGQCEPGWESWVDLVAPLSHSHAQHLSQLCSVPRDKWRVMYNGVDTAEFKPSAKVPGKMVWASSHDRGLHWVLEAFPAIKRRVPHAELHVFYDFDGMEKFAGVPDNSGSALMRELGMRSRYSAEALRRLEGKGVHVRRSVSRSQIREEMASAEVLAYPCDPVRYTETFGVTVLEALACGAVPVLCTADSFGELWGGVAPSVPPPYAAHKQEWEDLVVRAMTDLDWRTETVNRGLAYAPRFEWSGLGSSLEQTLLSAGARGLPKVNW